MTSTEPAPASTASRVSTWAVGAGILWLLGAGIGASALWPRETYLGDATGDQGAAVGVLVGGLAMATLCWLTAGIVATLQAVNGKS